MTPEDRIRLQHINYDKFDVTNVGEGGPLDMVLTCGHVTKDYRDNYDGIKWAKKEK